MARNSDDDRAGLWICPDWRRQWRCPIMRNPNRQGNRQPCRVVSLVDKTNLPVDW